MATGTQMGTTGFRTGTSPMTGTGRAPAKGSGYGKFMQTWNSLPQKQKTLFIAVGVCLLVVIFAANFYVKSSAYQPLYNTSLSPQDVREISMRLNEMGIPYEVPEGSTTILVAPTEKAKAQINLASYGLPHRSVMNYTSKAEEGGLAPQTQDDKDFLRLRQLEGEMTETIRQIGGIADAYVKITPSQQDYFKEDGAPAKAAIMVRMQPGASLVPNQISGIINLVAFSVKGLSPENVQVVDTNGNLLSGNPALAQGASTTFSGSNSSVVSLEQEKKLAYESELKKKVQAMLDQALGQNKAIVTVNADLDFSNVQRKSTIYDTTNTAKSAEQVQEEQFRNNGDEGGASQMSLDSLAASTSKDKNTKYKKGSKITTYKPSVVETTTVEAPGRVKRLTASVMVDNLKPEQVAAIKSIVKGAIGFDETRGDNIEIASMPFQNANVFEQMRNDMMTGANRPPAASPLNSMGSNPWMMYIMLVPMMLLVGVIAVFFMKQRKVETERTRVVLNAGPTATATDISDLLSDKVGRSTLPPATKVNTTEELEKLAKEKPTKVAELLKSTWLSEK